MTSQSLDLAPYFRKAQREAAARGAQELQDRFNGTALSILRPVASGIIAVQIANDLEPWQMIDRNSISPGRLDAPGYSEWIKSCGLTMLSFDMGPFYNSWQETPSDTERGHVYLGVEFSLDRPDQPKQIFFDAGHVIKRGWGSHFSTSADLPPSREIPEEFKARLAEGIGVLSRPAAAKPPELRVA